MHCLLVPFIVQGWLKEPAKHANARPRKVDKYAAKGTTQRGVSLKSANTKGGGRMTRTELSLKLAKLKLEGHAFFIDGSYGFPRCRACKKQIDKYEFRGNTTVLLLCMIALGLRFQ